MDANRFRIAANSNAGDVAAGGISVKQNTPVALGTSFDTRNGIVGYHFKLVLARPAGGHSRTFVIDAPFNKIYTWRIYDTASSATATTVTPITATVPATITVQWCEPDILLQIPPTTQTLSLGNPAVFTVVAVGTDVGYQWRRNGQPLSDGGRISGANSDTLIISNAQCDDVGDYECLLTDACGSISSGVASLLPDIQITQPPVDQALLPAQTATFTLQAVGTNLQYQWRKSGIDLQNGGRVGGVLTPTLTISNAQCGDAGLYDCIISDVCAAVASPVAKLIGEPVITVQPQGVWWLAEGMELEVGVPPGAPYQFRWRRNGQDLFNIPGLFTGVTTKKMTILSSDPSVPGDFDCVVSDLCGTTVSDAVSIVCPADFDKNTFVNGDDFDAFRLEFMLGNDAADIDQNGFVNGDDADYFYDRFVAGC